MMNYSQRSQSEALDNNGDEYCTLTLIKASSITESMSLSSSSKGPYKIRGSDKFRHAGKETFLVPSKQNEKGRLSEKVEGSLICGKPESSRADPRL